jgi:Family of unknown function (DUF6488)
LTFFFTHRKDIIMRTLVTLASFVLACSFAPAALAGGEGECHFHGNKPASESIVAGCAGQRKEALIKSGKLDASWQAVKQDKAEIVEGKNGKEWKVTFKNPTVADKTKEMLYIFYTVPGNFIAANFTGQ